MFETDMADPAFLALIPRFENSTPSFFDWRAIEAMTGCPRERYFYGLAEQLIVAGERLVPGYLASPRRQSLARHFAYTDGAACPPRRRTRAQQQLADATAFGLMRGAA